METIDRHFRPGFWRLSIPFLIASTLMVFLTALLSTLFEGSYPWVLDAIEVLFVGYALVASLLFVFLLLTRLRIHSHGSSLNASLFWVKLPIYRRSVKGHSWHVIARPGRSQMEVEGIGSYRVEVATDDGERISILGPVLCWLFRIVCL
jgi:hypothetical protein